MMPPPMTTTPARSGRFGIGMDWIDRGRHGISGQLRLPASHWPLTRPTRPRTLVFERFRRRRTSCPAPRRLAQQMRQMQRQRFALPANVGDRRDLPEHAAGQGAESEQALRNHTGSAAQRARRRHVETQRHPHRFAPTVAQQRDQRIAARRHRCTARSSSPRAQRAAWPASPPRRLKPHIDRALDRIAAGDATGVDAQLSARASGVDTCRDGRRHAMPMHVPPRPQMAQEALSIGVRQRLPDLLRDRPQAVDHRPHQVARLGHVCSRTDIASTRADRRAAAVASAAPAAVVRMLTRQQAAARYHMDRTDMSLIEQCDHRVDHRQAGADQQRRTRWIQRRQMPSAPTDRHAKVVMSASPRHRGRPVGRCRWRAPQYRLRSCGPRQDAARHPGSPPRCRAASPATRRCAPCSADAADIGTIQPARNEAASHRPHAIQQLWRLTLPASRGSGCG